MATSVASSLLHLLDSTSINEIASRLGEPGQSVYKGLESSTASLISSLAARSSNPSSMNQIFQLITQAPSDLNVSNLTSAATGFGGVSTATSSILLAGKKLMSLAFGDNQHAILDAIGRTSGLRATSVANLVSLVAPLLMASLGRLVRSDHLTQEQLGRRLVKERADIQSLLPIDIPDDFGTTAPVAAATELGARPLSIETVAEPKKATNWWWVPLLLLIPLLIWLINNGYMHRASEAAKDAGRSVGSLGEFVPRSLPGNVTLSVPQLGLESQMLSFIQDPARSVNQTTWFNFDRLLFNTDSAQLRPVSQEQLQNIAAIMKAYPSVNVKVGGYTDNTGDPQHNLRLSQERADSVVNSLASLGIARDRLQAEGYGEQFPVATNSTEEGRARNRRTAIRVTQK